MIYFIVNSKFCRSPLDFLFLMQSMLFAEFAEFLHFQFFLLGSFAFVNKVIIFLANTTLEFF